MLEREEGDWQCRYELVQLNDIAVQGSINAEGAHRPSLR